ncbi:hypothetical protein DPX16_16238 [Anabarilius grahami]|uniref:Uncharacterized protein n=1 Tax=Anabarilius grahami TaxID=495550 RepID=A0A3N0XJY1_ANAGA|nr:hypothetical protein DPX16_16238 [Anabarilius grahami]
MVNRVVQGIMADLALREAMADLALQEAMADQDVRGAMAMAGPGPQVRPLWPWVYACSVCRHKGRNFGIKPCE